MWSCLKRRAAARVGTNLVLLFQSFPGLNMCASDIARQTTNLQSGLYVVPYVTYFAPPPPLLSSCEYTTSPKAVLQPGALAKQCASEQFVVAALIVVECDVRAAHAMCVFVHTSLDSMSVAVEVVDAAASTLEDELRMAILLFAQSLTPSNRTLTLDAVLWPSQTVGAALPQGNHDLCGAWALWLIQVRTRAAWRPVSEIMHEHRVHAAQEVWAFMLSVQSRVRARRERRNGCTIFLLVDAPVTTNVWDHPGLRQFVRNVSPNVHFDLFGPSQHAIGSGMIISASRRQFHLRHEFAKTVLSTT